MYRCAVAEPMAPSCLMCAFALIDVQGFVTIVEREETAQTGSVLTTWVG